LQISHTMVDVPGIRAAGHGDFGAYVPRSGPNDVWLVASSPIVPGRAIDWARVHTGAEVLVPVLPYVTAADASAAIMFAMQLGALAVAGLPEPRGEIIELHLATAPLEGTADGDGRPGYRVFAGLAVRIK
jgi:hypothetical protein